MAKLFIANPTPPTPHPPPSGSLHPQPPLPRNGQFHIIPELRVDRAPAPHAYRTSIAFCVVEERVARQDLLRSGDFRHDGEWLGEGKMMVIGWL
ncbi:MAG: hypothetical protein FP824_08125 [Euryarchaeota archaeon]|nr:hypothetical protein [Euryarchaeota archaeon]MBU4031646.1 hypothetical protein [Candidatus Thermoplasmatota archaeon]MBU4070724.1 hypothetical protein [Candidatus Thermoplasmatota archaeon]MBU4143349.1 hypothetical protein [Candidatus Thermoplasmatota archaeon]